MGTINLILIIVRLTFCRPFFSRHLHLIHISAPSFQSFPSTTVSKLSTTAIDEKINGFFLKYNLKLLVKSDHFLVKLLLATLYSLVFLLKHKQMSSVQKFRDNLTQLRECNKSTLCLNLNNIEY